MGRASPRSKPSGGARLLVEEARLERLLHGSAAAGRVHLGLVRWCLAVLEGELCGVVSGERIVYTYVCRFSCYMYLSTLSA